MKSFIEFFLVSMSQNNDSDRLEESIDSQDAKNRKQLKRMANVECQEWSIIPKIMS